MNANTIHSEAETLNREKTAMQSLQKLLQIWFDERGFDEMLGSIEVLMKQCRDVQRGVLDKHVKDFKMRKQRNAIAIHIDNMKKLSEPGRHDWLQKFIAAPLGDKEAVPIQGSGKRSSANGA